MDFKHRVRKQSRAAELLIVVFTTLGSGTLVSVLTVLTMRTFGAIAASVLTMRIFRAIAAMRKLSTTTAVATVDYATSTHKSRLDQRKAEHKTDGDIVQKKKAMARVLHSMHETCSAKHIT